MMPRNSELNIPLIFRITNAGSQECFKYNSVRLKNILSEFLLMLVKIVILKNLAQVLKINKS